MKVEFYLRVWPLVGRLCSSGWPHTHVYMGSTNWTPWVTFKNKEDVNWDEVSVERWGVDPGRIRRSEGGRE